jgi:hypothetical protein
MKHDSPTLGACRILFVAGLDGPGSAAFLDGVAGKPMLTVSDLEGFAQGGGVAGFFVEGGRCASPSTSTRRSAPASI